MAQNIFSGKSNDEVLKILKKVSDDNQFGIDYGMFSHEFGKLLNGINNKINKENAGLLKELQKYQDNVENSFSDLEKFFSENNWSGQSGKDIIENIKDDLKENGEYTEENYRNALLEKINTGGLRNNKKLNGLINIFDTNKKAYERANFDNNKIIEKNLNTGLGKFAKNASNFMNSKAGGILSGLLDISKAGIDLWLSYEQIGWEKHSKIIEASMQRFNTIVTQQMDIVKTSVVSSMGIVQQTMKGDVISLGSSALGVQSNFVKENIKYEKQLSFEKDRYELSSYIAEEEASIAKMKAWGTGLAAGGAGIGAIVGSVIPGLGTALGGIIGGAIGTVAGGVISGIAKIRETLFNIDKAALEKEISIRKDLMDKGNKMLDNAAEQFKSLTDAVDVVNESLFKFDTASKKTALTFGFVGNRGQQYTNMMLQQTTIATKWGKEFEELLKNQETYMENAGRNVMISAKEQDKLFAAGRLFGMEASEISQIMGEMNIFNTSIENGTDTMREMYDIANQMGVSNKKFAKDLANNLKLAQKYNFAGGTREMMKMSLYAQQIRMDLNSVTQFSEKIISGGLDTMLETSAQLQVLGGNAAMYSDPFGMMYDAYNDTASMTQRIEKMVSGYGTLNRKTGETTFNQYDEMMMDAIGKALGMSREEIKNINREQNRRSVIGNLVKNKKFSDSELRSLSNRATFNQDLNRWEVTMMNGDKMDIRDLNKGLLESIRPEKNEEALVDYAQKSLSVEENLLKEAKIITAMGMIATYDTWKTKKDEQADIINAYRNDMVSMIEQHSEKIYEAQNRSVEISYEQAKQANKQGLISDYYDILIDKLNKSTVTTSIANIKQQLDVFERLMTAEGGAMSMQAMIDWEKASSGTNSLKKEQIESYEKIIDTKIDLLEKLEPEGYKDEIRRYKIVKESLNDGIISQNKVIPINDGQFNFGNSISSNKVIPMNDGEINNPTLVNIHSADRLYAAKSGGRLDVAMELLTSIVSHISKQLDTGVQTNSNLSVNGTLNVKGNNGDVHNLLEEINRDSTSAMELARIVTDAFAKNGNTKSNYNSKILPLG